MSFSSENRPVRQEARHFLTVLRDQPASGR